MLINLKWNCENQSVFGFYFSYYAAGFVTNFAHGDHSHDEAVF
jgi:hypothetical protein